MEMDNAFFAFVEKYRDDIVAFFRALVNFFKTILGSDESAEA